MSTRQKIYRRMPTEAPSTDLNQKYSLYFIMHDILETAAMELAEQCKREGYDLEQSTKMYYNAMMRNSRLFRGEIRRKNAQIQESVGVMSDVMYQTLKLFLDRCKDDIDLFKMYNDIKLRYPSKRGMSLADGERRAFEEILNER